MTLSRPTPTPPPTSTGAAPGHGSAKPHRARRESAPRLRAVVQVLAGVDGDGTADAGDFVHLDALIEAICAQGCKTVYQVMARLQAGQMVPELAHLQRSECNRVLVELDSIMAVYAENGSVCLTSGGNADSAPSN